MSPAWMQWLFVALAIALIRTHIALGQWDFAVTTKTKILFYDQHWALVTSAAHQFDQLAAITFDEAEEVVYFSDRLHNNGSIFALKLPTMDEDPQIITKIVQRTGNEAITSIAYDPYDRKIYWADAHNKKIFVRSIDVESAHEGKEIFIDFNNETTIPDGIAIDVCRRQLYWTNSNYTNASIERISLDGTKRHMIANTDLYMPRGIVVDQLSDRIYWVVDQQGIHFSVESANLNGTDRRILVKGLNKSPFNLAVTKDMIFWTDLTHNAIWGHAKFENMSQPIPDTATFGADIEPYKVHDFDDQPRGIAARTRYLTNLVHDKHCSATVELIKKRLLTPKPQPNAIDVQLRKSQRDYCLNDGDYIEQSGICICKMGFTGSRCQTAECHNYCVHGTCTMSMSGFPECVCQRGFHGERCHMHKCHNYCQNDGVCKIGKNGEAICECVDHFGGQQCEKNNTEICALFCRLLKHEPDMYVPFGCHDICEELVQNNEDGSETYAIPTIKHLEVCKHASPWNSTVIIVLVCGVVACFVLILLIVGLLRRFYKPARPRIKKTFVVRKQTTGGSDTPLTNRPVATEQCEITIENCCNMNICDTPCFDPKIVQQSLSRDLHVKEDKKMLIHNMDDDLY